MSRLKISSTVFLAMTCMSLVGCSSIELSETNTAKTNLSGEWVIDFSGSDAVPDFRKPSERQKRKLRPRRGEPVGNDFDPNRSGMSFIAHDFQVLNADTLIIEQNPDSMGIRYVPGVYRDISWGERQRGLWAVYAGWEEADAVVVSEARNLRVQERFILSSPNQLVIDITVRADGEDLALTRVFQRRR